MTAEATVLFAVDGTLVDPGNLYTLTWWEALWQHNYPVSMAQVTHALSRGAGQVLDDLIGPDRDHERDERINATRQALFARYWAALRPFDAAADLLHACADRGWRVVLASSASAGELAVLRETLGAPEAIAAAISAEDIVAGTSEADFLQVVLDQVGATAQRAVFVGGGVRDVRASRAVGVPCIALETGGAGAQELSSAGAAEVYRDAADLLKNLDASLLGRPEPIILTLPQPLVAR
jgi:phosphoglycolate phosphatase-like HAD superfamily hydrolase